MTKPATMSTNKPREGCDGYSKTAPVGSFPVGTSWCNALDMASNVWEWVADWYDDYPPEAQANPTGLVIGDYKMMRGGSWWGPQGFIRTTHRLYRPPDERHPIAGFRGADNLQNPSHIRNEAKTTRFVQVVTTNSKLANCLILLVIKY